jgi:hypothetical protein
MRTFCLTKLLFNFRRDLTRALKLLELVKRREKMKRDELQFSVEIFEKRYQAKDFSGQLLNEFTTAATKQRFVLMMLSFVMSLIRIFNEHFSDLRSLLFILISINIRPICLNTINGALLRATQIFI